MGKARKRGAKTGVKRRIGRGFLNKIIDKLPFEAHLPGLNFCGPGTKLEERLARGDRGVNQLDEFCKLHDISYAQSTDTEHRRKADKDLAERAWQRFKDPGSSLGEKAASWIVTTAMKAKSKLGGRIKKRKCGGGGDGKRGRGLYLKPYPVRSGGGFKRKGKKRGGVLPLLPVFAGLSALGSLVGGAASVAKAYNDIRNSSSSKKTLKVSGGKITKRRRKKKKV